MKSKTLCGKSTSIKEIETFVEYQTKEQKELRMVVDFIRSIQIDLKIEEYKALKC